MPSGRKGSNVIEPTSKEEMAANQYQWCLQEKQNYYKSEVFKLIVLVLPMVALYFYSKNRSKTQLVLLTLALIPLAFYVLLPVYAVIRNQSADWRDLIEYEVKNIPFVRRAPKCVKPAA